MRREENGKAMRAARTKAGLTQDQAAMLARLDQSDVSKMETGKFRGSVQRLEQYLEVLGLELAVRPKAHRPPTLDELDALFGDED